MIRRAERRDVPHIVRMLADDPIGKTREDPSEPTNPAYLAAFDAVDSDPNQFLAVLEQNGEIAGCLQLSFLPGLSHRGAWRAQIEGVRIASGHRRAGLGKILIEWAIGEARQRGCKLVQLTSDKSRTDARRFYERLGFTGSHLGMKLEL